MRKYQAGLASLRHRNGVRIDAGPSVENSRIGQLLRCLEEARLDAEDGVRFAGLEHLQFGGAGRSPHNFALLPRAGKENNLPGFSLSPSPKTARGSLCPCTGCEAP